MTLPYSLRNVSFSQSKLLTYTEAFCNTSTPIQCLCGSSRHNFNIFQHNSTLILIYWTLFCLIPVYWTVKMVSEMSSIWVIYTNYSSRPDTKTDSKSIGGVSKWRFSCRFFGFFGALNRITTMNSAISIAIFL